MSYTWHQTVKSKIKSINQKQPSQRPPDVYLKMTQKRKLKLKKKHTNKNCIEL